MDAGHTPLERRLELAEDLMATMLPDLPEAARSTLIPPPAPRTPKVTPVLVNSIINYYGDNEVTRVAVAAHFGVPVSVVHECLEGVR